MALKKSWRWVGAFGPDVMLCVASARVGLLRRSWWAVWDGAALVQGTRAPFELSLERGEPIEATTGAAWTRKTPLRVRGTVLGRPIDAPGLLDESAGRHPRRTSWLWSAGAGVAESGAAVIWNLVEGMHDGERTVWVDGVPHHVGALPFDGLAGVGDLRFTALATRAARENYVLLRSDYEQPFGTFTGSLPVAGKLRAGWGVMERHEALW
ncbi:MAG TPA: DUF2804 family protein [Solirubrobacter sp.]|nr:DUF2804 family protein [Solirubrobacter sp.]